MTLIHQFRGITVLKTFLDMLLNALQYHPMFLLKEHDVFAFASCPSQNRLLGISRPVDVLLISKALKHQETEF